MARRAPDLIDKRLLKALEHPTRFRILTMLWDEPSSPSRVTRQIDHANLKAVSHHFRVLEQLGLVKLVETIGTGPAAEHVYAATRQPMFTAEEWEALDPDNRLPVITTILRLISDDVSLALATGTIDELADGHLSRSPGEVDMLGWKRIVAILDRALEEVAGAFAESAERVASTDEELMPMRVMIMQFRIDRDDPSG